VHRVLATGLVSTPGSIGATPPVDDSAHDAVHCRLRAERAPGCSSEDAYASMLALTTPLLRRTNAPNPVRTPGL
jgi:hypothetical protein